MALTKEDILGISNLAKIDLSIEEQRNLEAKLNDLLKVFATLELVDTNAVTPMSHPIADTYQYQRKDIVTAGNIDYKYLQKNAPKTEAGLYLVPAVIE